MSALNLIGSMSYEQLLALGNTPIRILFYMDDDKFITKYTTERLQETLTAKSMQVEARLRKPTEKLDDALLSRFDEVWFFLRDTSGDGLDAAEIDVLRAWMDRGGGVLITGDHGGITLGHSLGLGHPIGRLIPRAGQLRVWDGSPSTNRYKLRFDSVEFATEAGKFHNPERDTTPQRLLLPVVADKRRHPIFRGRDGVLLDRLPDHAHEGAVTIDKLTDPDLKAHPPVIIARGVDHWLAKAFDLMAAWDGRNASGGAKGRILADSSWHHYLDYNLVDIAHRKGPDWEKIQALYVNQAEWLAPPGIQRARCANAVRWMVEFLVDEPYEDARSFGLAALQLLAQQMPGALFAELMPMLSDDRLGSDEQLGLPGFEVHFVSAYVRQLHRGMAEPQANLVADETGSSAAIREALTTYREEVEELRGQWGVLHRSLLPDG